MSDFWLIGWIYYLFASFLQIVFLYPIVTMPISIYCLVDGWRFIAGYELLITKLYKKTIGNTKHAKVEGKEK